MNVKQTNATFVKQIIALSGLKREDFAAKVLEINPTTLNEKLSGKRLYFSDKEVSRVTTYAKQKGFWSEYGFQYKTNDVQDFVRAIHAFSLMSVYEIYQNTGISEKKFSRLVRGEVKSITNKDLKTLLAFANHLKLDIKLQHVSI